MFGTIASFIQGIIGGLATPFFSWLNKKEDTNLEKFRIDGTVDQAALAAHVQLLQARRDILVQAMQYRGMRLIQYGFMIPLVIWFNAIVGYCLLHPYYPEVKTILALPSNLDYVMSGIIAFLFLSSKIDDWKRKT